MENQPRIELLKEKKLIGYSMSMALAENKTFELWQSFMRERKLIKNAVGEDLYSLQIYPENLRFENFNVNVVFEKWAAIEVSSFDEFPEGMETLIIPEGLYAVFIYTGLPADFKKTFDYIFSKWLPMSEYIADNRPHFEILGEKYKNNDPASEEEVWIPIRMKN